MTIDNRDAFRTYVRSLPGCNVDDLTIGAPVKLKDAYLDEALTRPVTGTIKDIFPRPDWGNAMACVVIFDHNEPMMPPGGEFSRDRLELIPA